MAFDVAMLASVGVGAAARGGLYTFKALGAGKKVLRLNKKMSPMIFKARILKETWDRDLEWQDIPYYAAPFVAQQAWDRYVIKSGSSSSSLSGNAGGGDGGTEKEKKPNSFPPPKKGKRGVRQGAKWCKVHRKYDFCWRKRK